jgi:hypothetical protein
MIFLQAYGKEIVALVVPFIAWFLSTRWRDRPKLHLSMPHHWTFLVQQPLRDPEGRVVRPTQTVETRSFILFNAGRETATRVELVLNHQPMCINAWPQRHYETRLESDARFTVTIESLAPKETIGFEVLTVNEALPDLIVARCDQCQSTYVETYPQPLAPAWKRWTVAFLLLAGIAAVTYVSLVLLQLIVLKTPVAR